MTECILKKKKEQNSSLISTQNIKAFRDTINYELPLIKNQLMDYNGKDLWNIVCSAMDWIETSTHWLSFRRTPELHNDPYSDSMNVIFYISAVHMLYEGVAQLYRVFYGDLCDEKNVRLMEGSKGIFSEVGYCKDDATYFKQIRAIYGEHSVALNLQELFYPPEKRKEHNGERWFASWSYSSGSGIPTEVYIYSNKPHVPAKPFSINLSEIENFAIETNNWIVRITDKAKDLEKQRKEQLTASDWPHFTNEEYKKHIAFLLLENEKRADNDWYRISLRKIRLILGSELECELVLKLKQEANALLDKLDAAIHNLEEMDDSLERIEPKAYMPHSVSNAYISLVDIVVEDFDNHDYTVWGDLLKDYVKLIVEVDDEEPLEEQYVLITAALLRIEERL